VEADRVGGRIDRDVEVALRERVRDDVQGVDGRQYRAGLVQRDVKSIAGPHLRLGLRVAVRDARERMRDLPRREHGR
jgi:hypothetical protein